MLTYFSKASPGRRAVYLLFAVTIIRLWYCTQLGLVADEAYYWLWSKHLAASYRDKGPAVAWVIALSTKLFGDTVFGVRFLGVLLGAGTGWLIFDLARRLYDEVTAWWCLLVALVMPLLAVGSIIMTIDSLSVFFWSWAVILFWKVLEKDSSWTWILLGLVIGAGFLAKFTNGVQLVCIGLFLLWSPAHRDRLFKPGFYLMCLAFLLMSLPILWWNVQTGWVHAMALHSRSGVRDSFGVHPSELLRFVGEVFGVVSPLFMAGMTVAAVALSRRAKDVRTRFLLSQFVPIVALFLFFSLNKAGKSNWIAPALVTGIVLAVVYWREQAARSVRWRRMVRVAFGMAAVMTLVLHITGFLHLPAKMDPLHRAQGWDDFAAKIEAVRTQNHATLLLGDHYSVASLMTFYLPDHPTTYLPPAPYGSSQFTLWPGYEVSPTTRALYVARHDTGPPESLASQFSQIKLVNEFWSQHDGRPMNHFWVYLCSQGD